MRRPSPLPQTPGRADAGSTEQASAGGARGGAGGSRSATDGTGGTPPRRPARSDEPAAATNPADVNATDVLGGLPIAPVSGPAASPAALVGDATATVIPITAAFDAETDATSAAPDAQDDADRQLGIRDVWRAARARRRALRAEVRRFTARQRRRRMIWIGVGASFLVLVLGTLGAAYSPLFAVEDIQVEGTSQLDETAVATALSSQIGTPLPLVDESAMKAALVTFPLIETYSLEARPPHGLVVRIVERTPVGVIQNAAGYSLVDGAGVVLSTSSEPPAGAPLITVTGGTDSDAFAAIGQVMRSLPESIAASVTAVGASSPDDVTLTLGGTNTEVVWGSAEESARKALVLETMMAARPPETVATYDVSSPDAVVVR
ncbi:hypothetical protein GCM10010460_32450 [Microbacterium terrae]|uniref:Cell division protein FtsQ n=1 Tax=Microbacterium terrae TaxID=69369 RepID=A0A0M2HGS0_9MICO|nr:Cell division protein FtsQ [Microbacterium terrae]GLJ99194.1 hypothetical protein GCM10017594_23910 [Microbacterium terrae]